MWIRITSRCMQILKILIFVFIFLYLSCDDLKLKPRLHDPNANKMIIPLAEGNYWTYRRHYQTFPYETDTFTVRIDGRWSINEKDIYQLTKYTDDGPQSPSLLVYNDAIGLQSYGYYSPAYSQDNLEKCSGSYVVYPINIGEAWNRNCDMYLIGFGKSGLYNCLANDSNIVAPSGEYACYLFQFYAIYPDEYYEEYYFPGVGLIKSYFREFGADIISISDLIEYHVN